MWNKSARILFVLTGMLLIAATVRAQYTITRDSLAKSASFTITNTLTPKGGVKTTQVFKVEVSGMNARLDYEDPNIGAVRYVVNEKGVFFVTPENKTAVEQQFKGGVEGALKLAFAQVKEQMQGAKKIGTATVSGIATDIYKDATVGTLIYIGKQTGFKLPVKTVLTNIGGTRTLLVTAIKLNPKIGADRFSLPAGTQIIKSNGKAGANIPTGGF